MELLLWRVFGLGLVATFVWVVAAAVRVAMREQTARETARREREAASVTLREAFGAHQHLKERVDALAAELEEPHWGYQPPAEKDERPSS